MSPQLALAEDAYRKHQQEIEQNTETVMQFSKSINITDSESYSHAAEALKSLKGAMKRIKDWIKPMKDHTHRAWKAVCDKEHDLMDPLEAEENRIKDGMTNYIRESELLQAEKQAKLQEQAQLQAAINAEEQGCSDTANKILNGEAMAPVVLAEKVIPTVNGISIKRQWEFTVTDKTKIPLEFLLPDEKQIRKIVQASGKHAEHIIPGITVKESIEIAAKGDSGSFATAN